jgi:hypothetical protein
LTGGTNGVQAEVVWAQAIHRVVTDGITPSRRPMRPIAQIKQSLSE